MTSTSNSSILIPANSKLVKRGILDGVKPCIVIQKDANLNMTASCIQRDNSDVKVPVTIAKTVPASINESLSSASISIADFDGESVIIEDVSIDDVSIDNISTTNSVIVDKNPVKSKAVTNNEVITKKKEGRSSPKYDKLLSNTRLHDLVKEIDPFESFDEEVEQLLAQLVEDFVDNTINKSCLLAKHRNSKTLEVQDVQLYLESEHNMWIPGFAEEHRKVMPVRKHVTAAHIQRMALIKKRMRKY